MIADRVLLRFPVSERGDVAVVSNCEVGAAGWRMLAKFVESTAENFERHEAETAAALPPLVPGTEGRQEESE